MMNLMKTYQFDKIEPWEIEKNLGWMGELVKPT